MDGSQGAQQSGPPPPRPDPASTQWKRNEGPPLDPNVWTDPKGTPLYDPSKEVQLRLPLENWNMNEAAPQQIFAAVEQWNESGEYTVLKVILKAGCPIELPLSVVRPQVFHLLKGNGRATIVLCGVHGHNRAERALQDSKRYYADRFFADYWKEKADFMAAQSAQYGQYGPPGTGPAWSSKN